MTRSPLIELSLVTLAILAGVAALKFAQNLIAPIVLGLVFAGASLVTGGTSLKDLRELFGRGKRPKTEGPSDGPSNSEDP